MVVTPDALKWVEPPVLPGARLAVVQGDPAKEGLFVYRIKMPAGYKIPPHLHKASENVTVLTGTFHIGLGEKFDQGSGRELLVGGFVAIPPKHAHYAWRRGDHRPGARRGADRPHLRQPGRRPPQEELTGGGHALGVDQDFTAAGFPLWRSPPGRGTSSGGAPRSSSAPKRGSARSGSKSGSHVIHSTWR